MPSIDLRHSHCGKREQIAERRVQALELRKAGLSYRQIAQRLSISPNRAHAAVRDALRDLAAKETISAEHVRQLELERLDLALTQVAQVLSRATSDETKLRAVDRVIRISESRRKLLGIDLEKATVNVDQRSVTFIIEPLPQREGEPVVPPQNTALSLSAESADPTHAANGTQTEGDAQAVAVPALEDA